MNTCALPSPNPSAKRRRAIRFVSARSTGRGFYPLLLAATLLMGAAGCGLGDDTSISLLPGTGGSAGNVAEDDSGASGSDAAVDDAAHDEQPSGDEATCATLSCPEDAPLCDPVTIRCVACLDDTRCEGETPHCGPARTCVECLSDVQCEESEHPHCLASEGRCVECTEASHCTSGICTEYECLEP